MRRLESILVKPKGVRKEPEVCPFYEYCHNSPTNKTLRGYRTSRLCCSLELFIMHGACMAVLPVDYKYYGKYSTKYVHQGVQTETPFSTPGVHAHGL